MPVPPKPPSPFSATLNRMVPPKGDPKPQQRAGTYSSTMFTFFTKADTDAQQIYTADQEWARVTVMLETAGPCAVATKQNFGPVLSGKGILLTTNIPITLTLARGNRLWIIASSVNRVKVIIEPVPWLEQILGGLLDGSKSIVEALMSIFNKKG